MINWTRYSNPLKRGDYTLAHMSQVLDRDEKAQEILRHPGGEAMGYTLTDEQLRDRQEGRDPGMPYRYLVRAIGASSLAWTAFYTRADLDKFIRAYGLRITGSLEPGGRFTVHIPKNPKFQALIGTADRNS